MPKNILFFFCFKKKMMLKNILFIYFQKNITTKFLKIQTPEQFAVIILKFEVCVFTIEKFVQKM